MDSLKTKITAVVLGVSLLSIMVNVAVGQIQSNIPGVQNVTGITTVGGLVDIVRGVVRWVYIIFFILAVLFILFAAFTYLTAGGEAEAINKAKTQLIYAAVAIAVALLAVGFQQIIQTFLTAPTTGT